MGPGEGAVPSCGVPFPVSQLVKLAKRLKKEKVNVDIINFGEEVSGGGRGRAVGCRPDGE